MSRPDSPYAYVSDAMYWLWLECKEVIPGVRLGGIYSNTTGYHNTRRNLWSKKPDSYSIRLDMDKKGSADLASGLDLTMSDAEMRKRTGYLRRSDLHPDDNRLRALREFIGTLDSDDVYCRIAGNEGLGQRHGEYDGTRDKSHLWHIHLSVLRAFAASWSALEPIVSVLAGETWEQWRERTHGMSWSESLDAQKWAVDGGYYEGVASLPGKSAEWHLTNAAAHVRALRIRDLPAIRANQEALLAAVKGEDVVSAVRAELAKAADEERAERLSEYESLVDQLRGAMSDEMGSEAGEAAARVFAEIVARGVDNPA